MATLFKHLRFSGVQIITLSEGEITELHVGLKGTMNALFLKTSPPKPIAAFITASRAAHANRLNGTHRPRSLLSGLLICECCGEPLRLARPGPLRLRPAADAVRALIERITRTPGLKRGEIAATPHGDLGTIFEWTAQKANTPGGTKRKW